MRVRPTIGDRRPETRDTGDTGGSGARASIFTVESVWRRDGGGGEQKGKVAPSEREGGRVVC